MGTGKIDYGTGKIESFCNWAMEKSKLFEMGSGKIESFSDFRYGFLMRKRNGKWGLYKSWDWKRIEDELMKGISFTRWVGVERVDITIPTTRCH